ncbi:4Fe-4S dicluster domain-containing protein [Desulfovibrio sp. OttesenSCG-928-A18]|nr:4Fe-4S dicluster domain-containing protein [Desulfovibrio sp. OttesenSCG-928-A18]
MKRSRRQFLKVASLSFLGLAGARFLPGVAGAATPNAVGDKAFSSQPAIYRSAGKAKKAVHWGMVIDTRAFAKEPVKFQQVIDACHKYHNVPSIDGKKEVKWIWTDGYRQAFTDQMDNYPAEAVIERQYLLLCNHCVNPACVRVCPTQATFRRSDGIVVMDYHRCIGCRFCMAGCPFGARSFNFEDPRPYIDNVNQSFPTRMRGVVEKCTFCSELLAEGKMPLCVEASGGAITFGDLGDPESSVRKVLAENFTIRRKPTLGTEPSVYYIL